MVIAEIVRAADLQTLLTALKAQGRRILAVSPSKMTKTGTGKNQVFDVTEYVVCSINGK